MKELSSNKNFKKPNPVNDAKGLSSLVSFMNDARISGAVVPKGAVTVEASKPPGATAVPIKAAPIVEQPTPQSPAASQGTVAPTLRRVFLTGRFKVGKDHIAVQAGCKIFNAADPLYFLAAYFFAGQKKDDTRAFLQTVGQWGRGTVSAEYPLTPERALFIKKIHSEFGHGMTQEVHWGSYGQNENIWLDSLIARAAKETAETSVAVSGVRFNNEYAALSAAGFIPFHVMTSGSTWAARLQAVGLTPDSPACKDVSEQLAVALDKKVVETLSKTKHGPKLRCVWSDDKLAPPSGRLLTVGEFCAMFPV